MCLTINQEETEKFKQNNSGEVTVWKGVRLLPNGKPVTPYRGVEIKPGILESFQPYLESNSKEVKFGIHCFTDESEARRWADLCNSLSSIVSYDIVQCTAKVEDLIAVGDSRLEFKPFKSAVFTKIEISEEAYNKLVKVEANVD